MFDLDYKIKPRELICCIVIISIMLIIGFKINSIIGKVALEKSQTITKAIQIENDNNLFVHAMKTNYGNCLVYGDIYTIDPVSCYEYGGEYMSVKREFQTYRDHPEKVDDYKEVKQSDGTYKKVKTGYHIEHHWSWDTDKIERNSCTTINFCGVDFPYGTIYSTNLEYLGQESAGYHHRYKYYGAPIQTSGTLFAFLSNNTISNERFYNNTSIDFIIEDAKNSANGTAGKVFFWIIWIFLIGLTCYGFIIIDNKWLE